MPASLVDEVARVLADDIVSGRLLPGCKLDEQMLADRFRTSRTPIREALGQLAVSGLVDKRPRRGAVVTSMTQEQILEMFEVMAELEGCCARLAAERMTAREKEALQRLYEETGSAVRAGDREAYQADNFRFHNAIYAGAHNRSLMETTLEMRRRAAPFRRAQFWVIGRLDSSFEEHGAVVEAIIAGDGDRAAVLIRDHLNKVGGASKGFARPGELPDILPKEAQSS